MSILIKGMEMPSECEYCAFCRFFPENGTVWCNAKNEILKKRWRNPNWTHLDVKRPDWCPLIEISPHGRLIDADKLRVVHGVNVDDMYGGLRAVVFKRDIDNAPTVIEAEGRE